MVVKTLSTIHERKRGVTTGRNPGAPDTRETRSMKPPDPENIGRLLPSFYRATILVVEAKNPNTYDVANLCLNL